MGSRTLAPGESWATRLAGEDPDGAWDAFLTEHRPLLMSVARAFAHDADDRMDAFCAVLDGLRANDFQRLRAWKPDGTARFTTWLVTVARNLAVDWFRRTHGRRRLDPALAALPPLQQQLYQLLSRQRLSFAEAYEVLHSSGAFRGSWREYRAELRALHAAVQAEAGTLARDFIGVDLGTELAGEAVSTHEEAPDYQRVIERLKRFPADVQLATMLFVVDELPAEEVARQVGWPDRKAVYNRVYRTLDTIRRELGDTR